MKIIKVLVVDDEAANSEIIKDSLEDVGYSVTTSNSVIDARKILTNNTFSLIILDIWMPEIDGISFLKELKNNNNKTPVIIISGHAEHNDVVEAMRLGAIDFIKKPMSDISSIVRNAINNSHNNKENIVVNYDQPMKKAKLEFEKHYLLYHLNNNNNNITKVAQISNIERTTLYRKLKKLAIK